jgi:hypothetical protein
MDTTQTTESAQLISIVLKTWNLQIKRFSDLVDSLSDEDLRKEIAPGKNSGIYLLGHMVATHDGLLPLLGFGSKLWPNLEQPFLTSPDKSGHTFPPVADLKKYWNEVNSKLGNHFNSLQPEEWLIRHTAVSAEDFAKEPHRNKLNVLLSRATHLSYHMGQMMLLKKKVND